LEAAGTAGDDPPFFFWGAYLAKILRSHWVRTAAINAYAFIMLAWAMRMLR